MPRPVRFVTTFTLLSALASLAAPPVVRPGEVWPDDRGQHVQAHGGGIIRVNNVYYWFGEQRRQGIEPGHRLVSCYSSKDLVNWRFLGDALDLTDPEQLGPGWVLERPKVFHNRKTKKFVMYAHLDDAKYKVARVAVAVSDKVSGPYKYVKSFRPLGCESRDIGQFIDDDGSAYLVFEDRPLKGFHIARLSEDYMDVEKDVAVIRAPLEGGAIVHHEGLYYAIGSALTGWKPNPNKYATAEKLEGPWSDFKDIAPPETNTYGSQSTMMLKVAGKKATTIIFMADMWKPRTQWDSRYLWMPLEIGGGRLRLPEPKAWSLDVKSGRAEILQ